jgi:hypothetical protein
MPRASESWSLRMRELVEVIRLAETSRSRDATSCRAALRRSLVSWSRRARTAIASVSHAARAAL